MKTHQLKRLLLLLCVPSLAFAMLMVACGGEDESSDSGAGEDEEAVPGVVSPKPDDATELDVTLQEFAIAAAQTSVAAGEVYFHVDNKGPEDAHEFVIVRTDLGPLDLPFEDNEVPEDKVDIVDEIEPFTAGTSASIVVDLKPGKYLLICNITETEADGTVESHYKKGMVAALTVE